MTNRNSAPAVVTVVLGIVCSMGGATLAFTPTAYGDASPCAGGAAPHKASAQEAASANPAGSIVAGVTDVCPNDSRLGISNDSGAAKQYLRGILCKADGDNYGGVGPDETINGLDNKFAVCAAAFLKAVQSKGTNVCVKEGKRSVQKQNEYVSRGVIACKKGAGCEHPRGIAIDVNVLGKPVTCSSYTPLHEAAPSFGLTFYMGCKDAVHFVPEKSGCTAGGTAPADSNLPSSSYDFPQYAPSSPPASAPNMPTQPQQSSSSGTGSSAASTPASSAQSSSPLSSTLSALNSTTSSSKSILDSLLSSLSGTSDATDTSVTEPNQTVSDLLSTLFSTAQKPADDSNTLKDITLNGNLSNSASLSPDGSSRGQGSQENLTIQPTTAGETFTSQDLQYSAPTSVDSSTSFLQSTIAQIKSALAWIKGRLTALI